MKLRRLPLALIIAAISPKELTTAINLVVHPAAFVDALIGEFELTISVLHAVDKHSRVDAAILELFAAGPILKIVSPEAKVALPIGVDVAAKAIGLAVQEFALVLITVGMVDQADTMSHAIAPLALVARTVGPLLLTATVLKIIGLAIGENGLELARVDNVISEVVICAVSHFVLVDGLDFKRIRHRHRSTMLSEVGNQTLPRANQGVLPRQSDGVAFVVLLLVGAAAASVREYAHIYNNV